MDNQGNLDANNFKLQHQTMNPGATQNQSFNYGQIMAQQLYEQRQQEAATQAFQQAQLELWNKPGTLNSPNSSGSTAAFRYSEPMSTKSRLICFALFLLVLFGVFNSAEIENYVSVRKKAVEARLEKHPPAILLVLMDIISPLPPGQIRLNHQILADLKAANAGILITRLNSEEEALSNRISSRLTRQSSHELSKANHRYASFLKEHSEELLAGAGRSGIWSKASWEHLLIENQLGHLRQVASTRSR